MNQILAFFKGTQWQDWATAIGIIFGVVTLIAYLDQRRSNKHQNKLIEFVSRHLDKDISEETIENLKKQQKEMQRQVQENLPALARAAVLKEQAELHASALAYHYNEWSKINTELENSPTQGKLDREIENIITDRISPKYEQKWALDEVRNRITILSATMALTSTFLFYPLNLFVAIPLALPLTKGVLEFFKLQGISQITAKRINTSYLIIYLSSITLLASCGLFFLLSDNIDTEGKVIGGFMLIAAFLTILFHTKLKAIISNFLNESISQRT